LMNFSLYLIVSRNNVTEGKAPIKYFVLSALTSTFIMISVALVYQSTATINYHQIGLTGMELLPG
jgi:NADH-quinone oxidoreductase subunit N